MPEVGLRLLARPAANLLPICRLLTAMCWPLLAFVGLCWPLVHESSYVQLLETNMRVVTSQYVPSAGCHVRTKVRDRDKDRLAGLAGRAYGPTAGLPL